MFIKGNFRKYIFKSDNGFTVGLFKVRDSSSEYKEYKNKTVTFTGYFSDLNDTDIYKLEGEFVEHERYGDQFKTSFYEVVMPEEKDNIIEFLSSDIFPGIGEKKASLIVDTLGEDTLKKILDDKEVLLTVKGVTVKQMDKIYNALYKYQENYETIVELNSYGFSSKEAITLYKNYGKKVIDIVKDNPYSIISEIYDISFNKIDSIRNNFNIEIDSKNRIEAGLIYSINDLSFKTGSTYFSKDEVLYHTRNILGISNIEKIDEVINTLIDEGLITKIDDKYFLTDTYNMEEYIAQRLFYLANSSDKINIDDEDISSLEEEFNIKFNSEQIKAIKECFSSKCTIITGGPGVGKTTIIKAITSLYRKLYNLSNLELIENLALLAPTGRASKKVSSDTLLPAYTIHRFLKWNKEDNSFSINEENKSNAKFVIIDESSMIDTYLLYNLLLGLKENTKIIFIGDYNQLPSVGPGQIFKDLIESKCINTVRLTKLYRQKDGSSIAILANSILYNDLDMNIFNTTEELTFIECEDEKIKDYLKDFSLTYKDMDKNEFQVLAPIYKGDNGIDSLNYFMQEILNEDLVLKNSTLVEGVKIYKDDKVIQLVNDPDNNVFNGDIGKVLNITKDPKEIIVDYDNNIVSIKPNNFSNIKLGYAISIHKAQGSEFDIVILIMSNKYASMLYKKLLYTGVSRAKKRLIIIGQESALRKCISNDKESKRKTYLKSLIQKCIK